MFYLFFFAGELHDAQEMVANDAFTTDIEFQEHVQSIFQRTIDAHTRYQKPACYNAVFVQPFAFNLVLNCATDDLSCMGPTGSSAVAQDPSLFLMENLYTSTYTSLFPDINLANLIGQEVTRCSSANFFPLIILFSLLFFAVLSQVSLLNGLEFTAEIASWSDTHEYRSNNPSVRFNSAIRSYLYRSAMTLNILPLNNLTITLKSSGETFTLPWMASYTSGLADVSVCAALPPASLMADKPAATPSSGRSHTQLHLEDPPALLHHETLMAARNDRVVIVPTNSKV